MPKMPDFLGGSDVHRSTNLSDNRLVNLYPVTNDKGDRTALVATPGLTLYAVIPGGAIASGIHKASNGRCFMVASTVLYEITAGGVLTNRGTITSGVVTRMEDNGIDLILVNGVDGWLFTFLTNTLKRIVVAQAVFTVTIATPAVFTKIAHTLVAGDRITLSTTGALPTGLADLTTYYVIAAGLTADAFQVSLTLAGAAVNTSGAQSGVHTFTSIGYGFPNGCTTISYLNGRFVACEPGTQNFYVSDPLDGFTWDVLNVQTVDANPDNIVGEIVAHNELIVFCEQSGESYTNSGVLPSPFIRNQSGIFEIGCAAAYSICKVDNKIMWLGKAQNGHGIVYRLDGYTPTRISKWSIEFAIQAMSDISDAIAFSYQQDGHIFYVLTFPTGGRTFVYDLLTNQWHERAGLVSGNLTRWEAQEYAFFDGKHLVCDYTEGNIYYLNLAGYADGTSPRKWLRSWRSPETNMKRAIHNKLTLELEVGVGIVGGATPTVMLKYSNDGGHTWSSENWRDLGIGALGEYTKRVFWHRLGMTSGQPRIYELSGTAPVKTVLIGAFLD